MYKIRKELHSAIRRPAPKSRRELTTLLARLGESMPQLMADHPESADFMPLFADKADTIARRADAADGPWLMDRIEALLENNGIRNEEYLPPHDLFPA